MIKLDENGDSLCSQTYGDIRHDYGNSLIQTDDGGYMLAGTTFFPGPISFLMIRTNEDGDSLWSRRYRGGLNDQCYKLIQASNGDYLLAGKSRIVGDGDYADDFSVIRVDQDGDEIWSEHYGGRGTDIAHSIVETQDGGFTIAGHSNSFRPGSTNFWLLRINEDGDSLWSATYGNDDGNYCYAFTLTDDGGYALVGSQAWFIKTGIDPLSVSGFRDFVIPWSTILYTSYPNPFNSTATIAFNLPSQQQVSLQMFDSNGRLIETLIDEHLGIGNFTSVWNVDNHAAGVYFYRLQAGVFQQTKKLTLIK